MIHEKEISNTRQTFLEIALHRNKVQLILEQPKQRKMDIWNTRWAGHVARRGEV